MGLIRKGIAKTKEYFSDKSLYESKASYVARKTPQLPIGAFHATGKVIEKAYSGYQEIKKSPIGMGFSNLKNTFENPRPQKKVVKLSAFRKLPSIKKTRGNPYFRF